MCNVVLNAVYLPIFFLLLCLAGLRFAVNDNRACEFRFSESKQKAAGNQQANKNKITSVMCICNCAGTTLVKDWEKMRRASETFLHTSRIGFGVFEIFRVSWFCAIYAHIKCMRSHFSTILCLRAAQANTYGTLFVLLGIAHAHPWWKSNGKLLLF